MEYLVVGTGGIATAVTKQLLAEDKTVAVIQHQTPCSVEGVDVYGFEQLFDLFALQLPVNVIIATGMLHTSEHQPEKNLQQFDKAWLLENIEANVLPTVTVTQALAQHMKRTTDLKVLTLSARVGSISDNRLGGWYSYRMSKAALNMLVKNISIEWQRQFPKTGIYAYHPGTVDTQLSKPFQGNISEAKLFDLQTAANYLLQVFANLTVEQTGSFLDWGGKRIDF